jgi:hypothetical protein
VALWLYSEAVEGHTRPESLELELGWCTQAQTHRDERRPLHRYEGDDLDELLGRNELELGRRDRDA